MAVVYLAEDLRLHRQVAIKMIRVGQIPPDQLPRMLERFKREAEALARLSDDPAIVTVHDYGEYEDTPYLVMAYMAGGTLKDMLGKPMDYRKAAEMLIPVTRALGEAHEQGIIHRDVKPSNLLVDKRGQLALADFGIAKALELEGQTLTGTGLGVGTPEYMAPEQWRGQASPQTDVYALGVVLYEMVTGKKPFKAENPSDIYLKQMTEAPVPPRELVPGLPEAVEDVLTQAMHREAGNRFADMDAFCEALQGLKAGIPLHDEIPAVVPQPVVEPMVAQQPDLEATYDELATPADGIRHAEFLEQNDRIYEQASSQISKFDKPQTYKAVEAVQEAELHNEPSREDSAPVPQETTNQNFWKKYGTPIAGVALLIGLVLIMALGNKPASRQSEPIIVTVEVTMTPNPNVQNTLLVMKQSTVQAKVTQPPTATETFIPTKKPTVTSSPTRVPCEYKFQNIKIYNHYVKGYYYGVYSNDVDWPKGDYRLFAEVNPNRSHFDCRVWNNKEGSLCVIDKENSKLLVCDRVAIDAIIHNVNTKYCVFDFVLMADGCGDIFSYEYSYTFRE